MAIGSCLELVGELIDGLDVVEEPRDIPGNTPEEEREEKNAGGPPSGRSFLRALRPRVYLILPYFSILHNKHRFYLKQN